MEIINRNLEMKKRLAIHCPLSIPSHSPKLFLTIQSGQMRVDIMLFGYLKYFSTYLPLPKLGVVGGKSKTVNVLLLYDTSFLWT